MPCLRAPHASARWRHRLHRPITRDSLRARRKFRRFLIRFDGIVIPVQVVVHAVPRFEEVSALGSIAIAFWNAGMRSTHLLISGNKHLRARYSRRPCWDKVVRHALISRQSFVILADAMSATQHRIVQPVIRIQIHGMLVGS